MRRWSPRSPAVCSRTSWSRSDLRIGREPPRVGMSETLPERRVTFLFDVDNTLIDNDRAKADLSARIAGLLGVAGERRFWELYEEVRHDRGLVNIPLLLARWRPCGRRERWGLSPCSPKAMRHSSRTRSGGPDSTPKSMATSSSSTAS